MKTPIKFLLLVILADLPSSAQVVKADPPEAIWFDCEFVDWDDPLVWEIPLPPILAQLDDSGQGVRHGGPGFEMRKGNMRGMDLPQKKHLDQFRMLKLLELLDLNEKQEVPFIMAFDEFRRSTRELEEERQHLVGNLASGLKDASISENEISALITSIDKNEVARNAARGVFRDKVKSILTANQFGKLIVFEERFELQLLEQIREFRERRGRGADDSDKVEG